MKVYFVRHGETEGNVGNFSQSKDTILTEKGKAQARLLAKRFEQIHLDAIISSDYMRAYDTALAISAISDVPVVVSELFHERVKPSVVRGQLIMSDVHKDYVQQEREHLYDSAWHYSQDPDEENMYDLRARAVKAKQYIEHINISSICIASHGHFLHTLFAVLIFGDDVSIDIICSFVDRVGMSNTGITEAEYENAQQRWTLITINDDAHLGELG